MPIKSTTFGQLQHNEDITTFFSHSSAAGWSYLQNKKLDLSMYCMRGVTDLSKSTNFGVATKLFAPTVYEVYKKYR
jgi:hypothetical protein